MRWTGAVAEEKAYFFIPDDPRLRTWAHQIADQRRHSLRKRAEDAAGDPDGGALEPDGSELDDQVHPDDAQLSLFAALSAVADEGPHPVASVFDEVVGVPEPDADDDPALAHVRRYPPSTDRTVPVTNAEASDARNW